MKTKWLVVVIAVLALSGIASANAIPCAQVLANPSLDSDISPALTVGTVSILNAMGLDSADNFGCYDGDVFFSNFNYSPNGVAAETANLVSANFSIITTVLDGLAIGGSWSVATGGFNWTYDETMCTIALCGYAPYYAIGNADVQESPAGATAIIGYDINGLGGINYIGQTSPPTNLGVDPGQPGIQEVMFTDTFPAPGLGYRGYLTGVTNDVYPYPLPEPGTMLLMGGALIGLGAIARKRRKA
jgi:hypothetical protein